MAETPDQSNGAARIAGTEIGAASESLRGWAGDSPFILGADISWTLEDEHAGARYYHEGMQQDLVQLLKDHGFNYVRLRTFVDPVAPGGYSEARPEAWCGLARTIEMAQRIKRQNMGFFLDFHYSDTWADPANQGKPLAWQELTFNALTQVVYEYTRDAIAQLKAIDVEPELVQIGNEITYGMLFPDGNSSNWAGLAELLKAGISGVKEVHPEIGIVLHIDTGGDNDASRSWIDSAIAHEVEADILGLSCYTEYQGPPSAWRANLTDLADRYPNLLFMIAEYSDCKREANDIVFGLPNRRGLGAFIWEPTRWMEAPFTCTGSRYDTNQLIDLYPQMALAYGLS